MIETKTRKKLASTKNIVRALRLANIFGKPSDFEEDVHQNLQNRRESLNAYSWIRDKNALLYAERMKAEALMTQQKQRFI